MEASPHPEKAVAAAERLRGMMPAAGHMEHMPAHIMQPVGRYEDSAEANRKGAAADAAYLSKTRPIDYYGMYVGHNFGFLAYSAAMEGRKSETLEAIKRLRAAAPEETLVAMGSDWSGAGTYREDLRHNPNNRWSLFGLSQALRAQHKSSEAAAAEAQFREAWQHADITLTSSVL